MAANTTGRLKLPYPQLADTPDIPRDIGGLAQKLDPALPASGVGVGGIMPIDSSDNAQFAAYGPTAYWHLNSLRLSKVMNQCSIMLNITRLSTAPTITGGTYGEVADQQIGTLKPSLMYPEVTVSGFFDSGDSFGYTQLDTSGVVWIRGFSTPGMNIRGGENLRVTFAYPGN